MRYAHPGTPGALVSFKSAYGNYIDGQFVEPLGGEYFMNTSPVDGSDIAQFPRSDAKDIDFALDAAHRAAEAWGKTSVQHRSNLLLQVADRIQENLEYLAIAESWDNGKPVRETLNADLPLAVDHFRYFAGCLRAQEGSTAEIDETTVAYHFHEPLGVVGQIIPWNFPLLMAAWKLAPALAAGNCVVLKPAEQTPLSITLLLEIIGDLFPPGVLNVVQGFGKEAGEALATSKRIAKIAFTGSTPVGRHILACAAENIIPATVELGGKSPNIYFADVMDGEEEFIEKAVNRAGEVSVLTGGDSPVGETEITVSQSRQKVSPSERPRGNSGRARQAWRRQGPLRGGLGTDTWLGGLGKSLAGIGAQGECARAAGGH